MTGTLLRVTDLGREPEFHLDQLLEVLRQVPDGYEGNRIVLEQEGQRDENGWELDVAAGYGVKVNPEYQCGWIGEGDGPVLTAITSRLGESNGHLVLNTHRVPQFHEGVGRYWITLWVAEVVLGQELPWGVGENPRAGAQGQSQNNDPGIAVLLAYLKAWGAIE